ncbi:glycosyltransferase family 87 protein [Gordonia neofelifaecis]|uniref:Integral membrane protein-like protein n=1 Tax=Gordonia neofelifaecis NRRL B-59395 TaxID=644548 RepID=F1YL42_9ACTN|nr:glycosyltransferase 87 family protein [Gordonia neofelifaecis]EGD54502.1 integral membrane protein-like protein [Gordonia neofelifaecis NRRL B-59395]
MTDQPTWDSPEPLADDLRVETDRVLPSWASPQLAAASDSVGGPVGIHAALGRSRSWTPVRVVLLLALVGLSIGWFGKAGCIQQAPVADAPGQVRLNWDNQRQFVGLCYSDLVASYEQDKLTPADLAGGAFPYRTFWMQSDGTGGQAKAYLSEPALSGLLMYVSAQAARGWAWVADTLGLPKTLDVVNYFNISALLLSLFWLIAVWATMMTDRRRLWLGALMALSPLVFVHAFTATDVLAIAMLAVAMLCWTRDRPGWTGVFAGLGAAAAVYPVLLLPAVAVICVRQRRLRDCAIVALTAVASWLVVNLPLLVLYPSGWTQPYRAWHDRGVEPDTLYRLISLATGWNPSTPLLNGIVLLLLVAVIAAVVYIGLRATTEPTIAQLMFLLVAGFLLFGKEWTPQASLWLVPLAVLAVPYPGAVLAWMTFDALVWIPRMGLFVDPSRKWLPAEFFYAVNTLRGAVLVGLCAVVVWQLVRSDDEEPTGGRLMRSPVAREPAADLPGV